MNEWVAPPPSPQWVGEGGRGGGREVPKVDRVAIVTGSTRGIGRAVAGALAGDGWAVVVTGRDAERVAASAGELEAAGARAHGLVADMGKGRTSSASSPRPRSASGASTSS